MTIPAGDYSTATGSFTLTGITIIDDNIAEGTEKLVYLKNANFAGSSNVVEGDINNDGTVDPLMLVYDITDDEVA